MKNRLFFIDCETTGLDPSRHEIWQFAYLLEIDGEVKAEQTVLIKPERAWTAKAKEMAGDAAIGIDKAMSQKDFVRKLILQVLNQVVDPYNPEDKLFLLAYNSPFDKEFLLRTFDRAGEKYFFSYFFMPDICVMRQAAGRLMDKRPSMSNFKQGTAAEALGIKVDPEKLHDAGYDLDVCRRIWNKVKPRRKR